MSGKDKLISVEHLKWNVGGIKCGTLSVDYLNWILDHEEPAVDAVPVRHGKFIGTEYDGYADGNPVYCEWECSECGCVFEEEEPTYKYCPNCGARMDAE